MCLLVMYTSDLIKGSVTTKTTVYSRVAKVIVLWHAVGIDHACMTMQVQSLLINHQTLTFKVLT